MDILIPMSEKVKNSLTLVSHVPAMYTLHYKDYSLQCNEGKFYKQGSIWGSIMLKLGHWVLSVVWLLKLVVYNAWLYSNTISEIEYIYMDGNS